MEQDLELMRSSSRVTPWRSPIAVSHAIKDILENKLVCDIGCGEGDNLKFFEQYTDKIIGMDNDEERYTVAMNKGIEVFVGDYLKDKIPFADVYYNWGYINHETQPILFPRLREANPNSTIVFCRDVSMRGERIGIGEMIDMYNGELRKINYSEGVGHRQSGTMFLMIFK